MELRLERQEPEFDVAATVDRVPGTWPVLIVNPSEVAAHFVGSVKHELHDGAGGSIERFTWHLEERDTAAMEAPRSFRADRLMGLCAYA